LPLPANSSAPTTLLCKAVVDGQQLAANLLIDYARKTVNGVDAAFSQTMITWATEYERASRIMLEKHELNRLAGTYRSLSEGLGLSYTKVRPTYHCERAGPPKF
jgi:hypothetical protein